MAYPTDNQALYDLAVQAGFFPPQGTGAPAVLGGVSDTPVPAPGAEVGTTEPAIPGSPAPQAQPSAVSPIVKPGPGTHEIGASSSTCGFDPGKYKQVSGQDAELYRDYAKADAEARASGAVEAGLVQKANAGTKTAQAEVNDAQVEKITAEGRQNLFMRGLQDSFAADEMKMNMQAQAASDQAKADYMAALSDFRATRVDPGQLWSNMTPGVRFGTLITAFVHDFLGAKGIKTSAMDTLNSAIDRNINAQVQALKTKGEVAEGFKSLWWMQRNQAASDAEARARVRGFLLEGAKQQVAANMSRYEAGLATAQGQAAIAAIDKELANNLIDIHRHIDTNILQRRQQALSLHTAKLQAAQASYANSLRAREISLQEKAQQAKAREAYFSDLIPDITQSGGNAMAFQFRPGVSDVKKKETLDKVEMTGIMSQNAREYRDMLRKYDSINDLTAKNRFADTNAAKMRELQIKIVLDDQLRRTGKAATEQERAQIASRFPLNTWATRANVEGIVAGFEKHGIEDMNKALATVAVDLPKDDPRRQIRGAGGFGSVEEAEAGAIHSGSANQTTPDQDDLKKYTGMLAGPAALERDDYTGDDKPPGYITGALHNFEEKNPAAAKKMRDSIEGEAGSIAARNAKQHGIELKTDDYPKYAEGIITLGEFAKQGKEAAEELKRYEGIPESKLETKDLSRKAELEDKVRKGQGSLDQIKRQSDAWLTGRSPNKEDDWQGALSAYILWEYENGGK